MRWVVTPDQFAFSAHLTTRVHIAGLIQATNLHAQLARFFQTVSCPNKSRSLSMAQPLR